MAKIEILLPAMGEGIIEATLTKILAPVGTKVEEDDPVVEVATDKVDNEVPTVEAGIIKEILFQEGDVIPVGQPIAILETKNTEERNIVAEDKPVEAFAEELEEQITSSVEGLELPQSSANGRFLSPLVRSIIKEESLSEQQVAQIKGSGLDGRLTKSDVLGFIEQENSLSKGTIVPPTPSTRVKQPIREEAPSIVRAEQGTELIEMDRMRRLISDHMVKSKKVSPHVTSFVEVDMTRVVKWRDSIKGEFQKKYGQKLTFTPIFIEAAAKALRDFPMVNVSVDGHSIIKKNFINIGMATALTNGNLIVPVIKEADQQNLAGLASKVNDLANRARSNKLKPDEIKGSTFSVTNVGSFGNITGTPIINQPEVAILAVGVIQKKPAVIETPEGDTIGIRHQMIMAMSYDHRVVDGALGGMFLKRVADYLETFDTERTV